MEKQNEMDYTIEDIEAPKELNEIYTEVARIVSPAKENLDQVSNLYIVDIS